MGADLAVIAESGCGPKAIKERSSGALSDLMAMTSEGSPFSALRERVQSWSTRAWPFLRSQGSLWLPAQQPAPSRVVFALAVNCDPFIVWCLHCPLSQMRRAKAPVVKSDRPKTRARITQMIFRLAIWAIRLEVVSLSRVHLPFQSGRKMKRTIKKYSPKL